MGYLLLQLLLELLFEDKLENHLKLSFRRNGCVVEHFEKYHFNYIKELKNLVWRIVDAEEDFSLHFNSIEGKEDSLCISIELSDLRTLSSVT